MRELFEELLTAHNLGNFIFILDFFYKAALSAAAFIIGTIILKILTGILKKVLSGKNKTATILTIIKSILKYFVYICVLCQVLIIFGINPASILAVAGVGSVAIGLGAQDLVGDIISGIFILVEEQYEVGDIIKTDSYQGTVESIGIKTTRLRSSNGDVYIIPNREIKIVTNCSKGFNRATVDVDIAYEENTARVIELLREHLKDKYNRGEPDGAISVPEVLGITSLGESGVTLRILADCEAGKQWEVERKLRLDIKNFFDENNITIPYPQRVIYIRKEENNGA